MTCLSDRLEGYTRHMTDVGGCEGAAHLECVRPR